MTMELIQYPTSILTPHPNHVDGNHDDQDNDIDDDVHDKGFFES